MIKIYTPKSLRSLVISTQMPRSEDFFPKNFEIVTKEGFTRIVLRREFNNFDNAESLYLEKLKALSDLYKWAVSLPTSKELKQMLNNNVEK